MIVNRTEVILGRIMLVAVLLLTLLPFASMLTAALQSPDRIPNGFAWPTDPHWDNFVTAFVEGNIGTLMLSSIFIVAVVVPVSILFATLAGYAMGNLRIPGGRVVLIGMVVGLTVPFEAIVIPLYYQLTGYGLINTQWAIILPLIGLYMPFSVFWMRAHFVGVPRELSEAARVDGANIWQEFRRIQLPLASPALSALAILLFLWTWNQFLLPLVMVDDPSKRTMAGALGAFQGQYIDALPLLFAASLIVMLPTVIVYVIFQRQFIKALLQGAVKG
ncbi:MAG: carbohydrate ABC transporter permease [Microbacterium sp.]|uniref:carbohydrate ABC transporter permease n=1 Tax=Microbacterium sp. TaxID=51671 RepID=UPI001AC2CA76|nr:carbohydrate ABC transporter permease [Microbacterium sp.]MBN9155759.1 carbohydrate ABC transporter permease [Microbacterium sp.]MBN9171468.1 carbohydrate ABC transporter permease [Microbacterium sp.]MBN9172860.1 carbohydrate ABC transporter permease [Microbacterium sp.]MBN9181295.1 carbohydrate ABC transporter permease [Microbacterium sp.]MBN9185174.1 carbohydrate ABC transporter permease [Microbacterium sp.]